MEDELLKLTRAMDALWVDLLKQAVEEYKKSYGFEMGLYHMGQVSLEYGYRLALARLRAWHPSVEIEEDTFTLLIRKPTVGRSYIPVFQIRMEKMKEVKRPPL
ncbi:hypothetical protein BHE74_00025418 [Ensete ventricosum]|nr:hypothetical protein BHE74_00025418 [Ensete ventricosum]